MTTEECVAEMNAIIDQIVEVQNRTAKPPFGFDDFLDMQSLREREKIVQMRHSAARWEALRVEHEARMKNLAMQERYTVRDVDSMTQHRENMEKITRDGFREIARAIRESKSLLP